MMGYALLHPSYAS